MSVLDTLIKVLRATSIILIKEFDIFIMFDLCFFAFVVETPIPKAKRSGIGKLNNPAQRRV
jgi:hypothetical protein